MTPIEQRPHPARRAVILCADDYAMTAGISAGIEELAGTQRLSATSALVTGRHWREHGPRVGRLRERLIVGLHFNLTLGSPLSSNCPGIAPDGTFSRLGTLIAKALTGRLPATEIADELHLQLDAFEAVAGAPPDMIDGHQHVHAVPGIRDALLTALARRFPGAKPLLRDPADLMPAFLGRRGTPAKAVGLSLLTAGFGRQARRLGFATNIGFSGVSDFDDSVPYAREIEQNLRSPGPRHLMMCHPGYPDDELATLDPVVERRRSELQALKSMPDLPSLIHHPRREPQTGAIVWAGDTDAAA